MMKNIKNITISILAIIGLVAIITAFTNHPQETNQTTTPESHIWEMHQVASGGDIGRTYLFNKVTGEIRRISNLTNEYRVLTEDVPREKKKK